MTFVVEDGSGLADANSYLSVADADDYWSDHGAPAAWSGTTSEKETALRLASQYLDARYGKRWIGCRWSREQGLDWPRASVLVDGFLWPVADIHPNVLVATAELALRSIENGDLLPDLSAGTGATVKKEFVKVGPLASSIEYGAGGSSSHKVFALVDAILKRLLEPGGLKVRA